MNLNKIDVRLAFLMESEKIDIFNVVVVAYHMSHRHRQEIMDLGIDPYAGEYIHAFTAVLNREMINTLAEKSYVNRIMLNVKGEE